MQGYRMYIGGDLMNKTDEWICQCGRINSGKFCSKCGREKTVFVKKQVIAAPNNGTSNNNIIKVLGIVAVVAVAAYGSYALVESNSPSAGTPAFQIPYFLSFPSLPLYDVLLS